MCENVMDGVRWTPVPQCQWNYEYTSNNETVGTQGSKLWVLGAKGSLEFSSSSLKFLQGAQRCTGFYTQHL